MFQRLTANLIGAQARRETLDGREYLVVPTVMLTQGVHKGSEGPLLYTRDHIGKNPQTWNHKPVVLYHPVDEGGVGSACTKDVIERQGVGILLNTDCDGRLKTEVWADEAKFRRLDLATLTRINNGEMVEVSTGLWNDIEPTPGEWNGEKYTGVVTNIQPDHLAILPDQKGACSIADGAGLLRNANADLSYDDIRDQIRSALKATSLVYCYIANVFPKYAIYECDDKCYKIGYTLKNGKVKLATEAPEEVRKVTTYMTANNQPLRNEDTQGPLKLPKPAASQLSDVVRRQQMQSTLEKKYSGVQQEGDWGGWVTDLYANYVVWSKDGKLFRLPYTYDDDKINFQGEPEEVERVSEYRRKNDTPIDGTQSPIQNKEPRMATQVTNTIHQGAHDLIHDTQVHDAHAELSKGDGQARTASEGRKAAVNSMVSGGHAKEEDRKYLEDLPDDHFQKIQAWATRGATTVIQPYSYAGIGDRSSVHGGGNMQHNAAKPMTANEYIETAPPEFRDILKNALTEAEALKGRLIQRIVGNAANAFHPDWLKQQSLDLLKGLVKLAGSGQQVQQQQPPTNNFAGQAQIPMLMNQQIVDNAAGDDIDILPVSGVFATIQEKKVG